MKRILVISLVFGVAYAAFECFGHVSPISGVDQIENIRRTYPKCLAEIKMSGPNKYFIDGEVWRGDVMRAADVADHWLIRFHTSEGVKLVIRHRSEFILDVGENLEEQ